MPNPPIPTGAITRYVPCNIVFVGSTLGCSSRILTGSIRLPGVSDKNDCKRNCPPSSLLSANDKINTGSPAIKRYPKILHPSLSALAKSNLDT